MTVLRCCLFVLLFRAAGAAACPELPLLPDGPNAFELQYGATNVNAALGSGALTAAYSACGELTVLKWPGPSYYNHLNYPILNRTALSSAYDAENLVARGKYFRAVGDAAALAELKDHVRFFIAELTTPGTLHLSEAYARVQLDLNGDGVAPDYLPENDVPHVWEHAYLYTAAMLAFGSR